MDNCVSKGAMLSNFILDGYLQYIFELKWKSKPFFPERLISLNLFSFKPIDFAAIGWSAGLTEQMGVGQLKI